jgi:hypothetical protein
MMTCKGKVPHVDQNSIFVSFIYSKHCRRQVNFDVSRLNSMRKKTELPYFGGCVQLEALEFLEQIKMAMYKG